MICVLVEIMLLHISVLFLCRYFESYADHFGVTEKIRFNRCVLDVQQIDGDCWKVTSCPTDADETGKPHMEYTKVSTGN